MESLDNIKKTNTLRNNMGITNMNVSTAINKELSNTISSLLNKTNKVHFDSLQIGSYVESEGGYYTGLIRSDYDKKLYAIFLAPNGIGDNFGKEKAIHSSNVAIAGTQYLSDGWMNTNALVAFNNDTAYAGGWSRSLVINGKDDWYLPSRDELEMCYRKFKPDTTANDTTGYNPNGDANCYNLGGGSGKNLNSVPTGTTYTASVPTQTSLTDFRTGGTQAFKTDDWYLASTQNCVDSGKHWWQVFSNGHQYWGYKTNGHYVRAVRRVLVQE